MQQNPSKLPDIQILWSKQTDSIATEKVVVVDDIDNKLGNLPHQLDSCKPLLDARNLEIEKCTIEGTYREGFRVAAKRDIFDRLSKKEEDIEPTLKRLKRSCLKQPPNSSGSVKKKRGKRHNKSITLPSDQTLILEYFRGTAGDEKGS